jgi:excinuclease ABC subunit A
VSPREARAALRAHLEPSYQGTFTGAKKYVLQTFANSPSAQMKKRVSQYLIGSLCPACEGKRLKREALSVTFAGYDIGALSQLPLTQLVQVLEPIARGEFAAPGAEGSVLSREAARADLARRVAAGGSAHAASGDARRTPNLSPEKRLVAERISRELLERVRTLTALGLGYLSLERSTPTLSPGELQRLRLATQIRSNLFGVVYVLDEPSAGLHPADGEALLTALDALKEAGNSLFVVEHDLEVMRHADWLVDVGPDAGEQGGEVLYSGPPEGLRDEPRSHTARYLFGAMPLRTGPLRTPTGWLELEGVTRNNLHGVDAAFPLGVLTAVTGISGSGKSSLVSQALLDLVAAHLGSEAPEPDDEEDELGEPRVRVQTSGRIASGAQDVKRLVRVDQKPIGRTPRSNLATYTGLFDQVRRLFAGTKQAKARGYDAGRFSFNVAKGRCETCEGEGFVSVELLFMPSVYAPCPTCHGARYNEDTLRVTWSGKNVAEVLGLTVTQACAFFAEEPLVLRPLTFLQDIGLGYLRLGQPATELSGGEAQRIKLATELQRVHRGGTLYVLDEPTTGLHPADVDKLMVQLEGLVDGGNTVIVVEHELRVVARCDWVIDMGPGAGDEGGRIIAAGTPGEVAKVEGSRTGEALARLGAASSKKRSEAS